MNLNSKQREYKALIWDEEKEISGLRVSVMAYTVNEAMEELENQHGNGNVYNLHNENDANSPRSV